MSVSFKEIKNMHMHINMNFPSGPVVETVLPLNLAWVGFMVGELRSSVSIVWPKKVYTQFF